MKVLKFGGTSLGDSGRIQQVADIVRGEQDCVVVCSAMAGVTNTLTEIASAWRGGEMAVAVALAEELQEKFHKTCYELFPVYDHSSITYQMVASQCNGLMDLLGQECTASGENWLLARGEVITSQIFLDYLNALDGGFELLDAFRFMRIDESGEPSVDQIRSLLKEQYGLMTHGRYITQGFICLDHEGNWANLQRGGSDYTATLLGAALRVTLIEIWTDIDGVRNNDPRFVDNTEPVRLISFGEAAELAYFGAKILHPSCVWPARSHEIPIHLRNTMEPSAPGTVIEKGAESKGIRAVAAKDGITVVRIRSGRMLNAYGFLRRVFEIFETWKTPIDVITTSEVAVSVTIDNPTSLEEICRELDELGDVSVEQDQSIICIVGDILREHQGYAALIMESLKHFRIKMVSFGGSRNNLTVVLPQPEKREALLALQRSLFSSPTCVDRSITSQSFYAN